MDQSNCDLYINQNSCIGRDQTPCCVYTDELNMLSHGSPDLGYGSPDIETNQVKSSLGDHAGVNTGLENEEQRVEAPNLSCMWRVVVHNDPVNLMSYVENIFAVYFGLDSAVAHSKMMEVHNIGRSVLARGVREQMERDAQAMHTYGLWATIEPTGDA